jgi:hypothetical protein
MERFWTTTKPMGCPSATNLGIGVTAYSEEDARAIIADQFPKVEVLGLRVVDDLSTLDDRHVLPNVGDHMVRGVWFPRLR